MRRKTPLVLGKAFVYRLVLRGVRSYAPVPPSAYLSFLRSIRVKDPASATYKKLTLQERQSLFSPLTSSITGVLSRSGSSCVLVFEVLWDAKPRDFDRLAGTLLKVLGDPGRSLFPACIVFAVSRESEWNDSEVTRSLLLPLLRQRSVACIVQLIGGIHAPIIKLKGRLYSKGTLPGLTLDRPSTVAKRRSANDRSIADCIDLIFGHFIISTATSEVHCPVLLSIRRLVRNDEFVMRLRDDIEKAVGQEFQLVPVGIQGSGLDELANALPADHPSSVLYPSDLADYKRGTPCVLLTELFHTTNQFASVIDVLKARGSKKIALFSVAACRNVEGPPGYSCKQYSEIPCESYSAIDCKFCNQGVPAISGDSLYDVERDIRGLEPAVFWELISSESDYRQVGHWISSTTNYHYHFRIQTLPIFRMHSYAIAVRIRNLLRDKGICLRWVHRVVCPDETQSRVLANSLAEVLQLHSSDVIPIPREQFAHVAGRQIDTSFMKWLASKHGAATLAGKNTIIVDQAAHHFKTFAALASICEHLGGTVLAFTVFLDRTAADSELGDFLPHSHYVRLYSWPCGPKRLHECACKEAALRTW